MPVAHSRITSQGQISVPAEVRRKLGVGPGSVLEWEEQGDAVVVRRAARYSSADIHAAVFGSAGKGTKGPVDTKAAIRRYLRRKHARR